ncbi:NAD-dependent epimerase/dehydratase family protein [Desulfarculus baarsii]
MIGASGFIGGNLFRALLARREDVIGTVFSGSPWRLAGVSALNTAFMNLHDPNSVRALLNRVKPKVIFHCAAFGAYSFENDADRIHHTNYISLVKLLESLDHRELNAFIHAGSSSEYGFNAAGPAEDDRLSPNSHYAVSKAAASLALAYHGKARGLPVCNLRLYSVYGPYEDSSRLMPVLCEHAVRGCLPPFAPANTARDFVYIDDVIEAFLLAAAHMGPDLAGESFNIGTGEKTTLGNLAALAGKVFDIQEEPRFTPSAGRSWDMEQWYANPAKAERLLGWRPRTPLAQGLISCRDWWREHLRHAQFQELTKKTHARKSKNSLTAIIACYRDEEAIPIMHERLVAVFNKIGVEYEIIFVDDCSPDNGRERIREISAADPHVLGISHSRNFGSQAAFRSGMELASKEACVLLDGDLQDPPEIIEQFVEKWRQGADVVYGRRVKREMPFWLDLCYKGFYRIFAMLSEVAIPKDAGDFSLIDRSVMQWILQCEERDFFLRGIRAYVGFNQVGVDYVRPERMFGRSTNNWIRNIGWAKKAIFSFSRTPLHMLTFLGGLAFAGSVGLALASVIIRLLAPESTPKGMTFLSLLIMLFGSATLLGLGLLGEYLGKVFEEAKARPPFIRKHFIMHGRIKPADARPIQARDDQ